MHQSLERILTCGHASCPGSSGSAGIFNPPPGTVEMLMQQVPPGLDRGRRVAGGGRGTAASSLSSEIVHR